MEKWVYIVLRVLAVGMVVGWSSLISLGMAEAWMFFTTDHPHYTRHEEIVNGVMDVVAVVVVSIVMGGLACVLWNFKKVLAKF